MKLKYAAVIPVFILSFGLAYHAYNSDAAQPPANQNLASNLDSLTPGNGSIPGNLGSFNPQKPFVKMAEPAPKTSVAYEQSLSCRSDADSAKSKGLTEAAAQEVYYSCLQNKLHSQSN